LSRRPSPSPTRAGERSWRYASASTGSRWRSSWPPPGCGSFLSGSSRGGPAAEQVTAFEVGFFSTQNKNGNLDNNFGFWRQNGKYHEVNFPAKNNSTPPQDQLLGINDTGTAVGFYNDNAGNSHGFAYNIATTKTHPGKVTTIAVPGATATSALGLNDNGWVVGFYTTGSGNSAATHGFLFLPNGKFITKFDDPNGLGNTTLNGINNENDIVGFYGDAAGNTDGLVAFPPF
jgi:hypothetical protein